MTASCADSSFQPLAVGYEWNYMVTAAGQRDPLVMKVTGTKKMGTRTGYIVQMKSGKEAPSTSVFYWTDTELIQAENSILKPNPAFIEFKLPAKAGTKWNWAGKVTIAGGEYNATGELTLSGPAKVTVPAGSFDCISVNRIIRVKTGAKTMVVSSADSYARGVGWVKGKIVSDSYSSVTELQSYKLK